MAKKIIVKLAYYSYWIVCTMLFIYVSFMIFFMEIIERYVNKQLIHFGFWYVFGIFSGFYLMKKILKILSIENNQLKY